MNAFLLTSSQTVGPFFAPALLRELVPKAVTIGMLVNPNDPWAASLTSDTQSAVP